MSSAEAEQKRSDEKCQATDEDGNVWLVAIGSMINPTSVSNRDLTPIRSIPGVLHDYKIYFTKTGGMASTAPDEGNRASHGVVHLFNAEDIARLDTMESSYDRIPCVFGLYDGSEMPATVYSFSSERGAITEEGPPTERYLDIIIRGCRHFGVSQDYISYLQSLEFTPRKTPDEFVSFGEPPEGKVMTLEEVKRLHEEDGRRILAMNYKVIEFGARAEDDKVVWVEKYHGSEATLRFAKGIYEPLYPVPTCLEDMGAEHRAFCEDFFGYFIMHRTSLSYQVIAAVHGRPSDDDEQKHA